MAKNKYTADDIKVLKGLEPVRERPGMYIGTTDVKGLHHILWEIVDNAIDEAENGYASQIDVILNDDGSVTVADDGRGIPVDKMKDDNKPAVEVIFTVLHAGGKFDSENYGYSAGLHGVGASVTNALSEWTTVQVFRGGQEHRIDFHSPCIDGKVSSGIVKNPLYVVGKSKKHGTTVTFKPDARVFDSVVYNAEDVCSRLREYAFLVKGVKLTFTDMRFVTEDREPDYQEFYYEKGLEAFVSHLNDGYTDGINKMLYVEGEKEGVKVQLALQHTASISERFYSFVNNVKTTEGGTHVTGFRSALTRSMNEFAKNNNSFKNKENNLIGDDFREGLTAVLAIKMRNPQFEGQTKTKLGNQEIKSIVEGLLYEKIGEFFTNPKNKGIGDYIIKKAIDVASVREASRKAAQIERSKNAISGTALIGKFAACTGKVAEQNELFIVEGDSAGGSAKQGRDRKTQAVLPLRGKPLNVLKVSKKDKIYENEEIRTIIAALGTGIGASFKLDDLKFHKIIILSDADYDGYHIRTLLLSFFYRLMPELITAGKVYVGMPPLYKVEKKDKIKYAYDDVELDKVVEEFKSFSGELRIQRYKGLGEMNKEQLWDTTLNPRTRVLTRVTVEDALEADTMIDTFMTEGAEKRKNYIFHYAKFNKVDEFDAKYGGKN